MYISRLKLLNWRNFDKIELDLVHRVFIVGANASGKSNLLDVIRFLRDIVKQAGGLQYAVEQRGGVSKIRCLAARKNTNVEIEVEFSDDKIAPWRYRLVFKHAGGGIVKSQAIIVEEEVWQGENRVLFRNIEKEDDETLKFTHLEQPTANSKFRDIYYFLRDVQYLHIVPQLVRDAESYMLSANKEDFYGRNLLDRMNITNKRTRDSYLKRISDVLKIAVPQLKELTFVKDDNGVPHLQAVYIHWRAKGAFQQEKQFSDGTLRLIGFIWALLDGQETILMEEPELYLHTAIVKQLPEFISKSQKKKNRIRQVILTTHSYDLISGDGINSAEVVVLTPSNEGTHAETANKIEKIKNYLEAGFNMADSVIPEVAPERIERLLDIKMTD